MCPEAYAIATVRNTPKATLHCPHWPFTARLLSTVRPRGVTNPIKPHPGSLGGGLTSRAWQVARQWVGTNSRNCQQVLSPGTLDAWPTPLFLAGYQGQEGLQDWVSHKFRIFYRGRRQERKNCTLQGESGPS